MLERFEEGGQSRTYPTLMALLKKEDEEGYVECLPTQLDAFLDALIISRRGRQEPKPGQADLPKEILTNNVVLRKIRIALELKDTDIIEILKLAEFQVSKSELGALFRRKGHKNYKECGNQFLRNFLRGLAVKYRKSGEKK
jgi:uncharacterized protein YehS (DUF1456 family)